jgi:hypothetical protein
MRECSICYEKKTNYHPLLCCSNSMCKECYEKLRSPSCPFCRSYLVIPRRHRSNSTSIVETNSDIYYEDAILWNSIDDTFTDSRWYRRHRRRLLRLRERENLNDRNRQINRQRSNSESRRQRRQLEYTIRQEIREYEESRNNS